MQINELITQYNRTLHGDTGRIKYIVIHYVGAVSTAENNARYFFSAYRGSGAHYFVDENAIWWSVYDKDIAWHCGAKSYKHASCRNSNSIGIEMCCKKDAAGNLYVMDEVVARTAELTRELMARYGVPAANVLRHYDVTGKHCPGPMVSDPGKWDAFKAMLGASGGSTAPAQPTPTSAPAVGRYLYHHASLTSTQKKKWPKPSGNGRFTGSDVQWLQQVLVSQGIGIGNIDADFGPKTHAGVREFQKRHGLGTDGIVGPKTVTAMGGVWKGK